MEEKDRDSLGFARDGSTRGTRRMTAKVRSRVATYPEERYSRKSTAGSPIYGLTGSGWLAEK
jgi:hypothetical protein